MRLIFFVDNLVVVKGLLSRIELWHIYLGKPLQAIRECILIRGICGHQFHLWCEKELSYVSGSVWYRMKESTDRRQLELARLTRNSLQTTDGRMSV